MAKNRKNSREKAKESNWQERVIQIRRVSKVVKGGKKLSFRAIVVVGNEKGQVGVGVGKAGDVIGAVRKGVADGKKQLRMEFFYREINRQLNLSHGFPTGLWFSM